jgi:hypothetical protein
MNSTLKIIGISALNLFLLAGGLWLLIPILTEPVLELASPIANTEAIVMQPDIISGAKYRLDSGLCTKLADHTDSMVINTNTLSQEYSQVLTDLLEQERIGSKADAIYANSKRQHPQFVSDLNLAGFDNLEGEQLSIVIYTDECDLRLNRSNRYAQ